MTAEITQDILDKLDRIDWESLKNDYGIAKDTILRNPTIARQLAYGQMTDLVPGRKKNFAGEYSLRAFPTKDSDMYTVHLQGVNRELRHTLYGQAVPKEMIDTLLTRSIWKNGQNQEREGLAYANAGEPLAITIAGKEQQFIVSYHEPTNTLVGMEVGQVRAKLERNPTIYGEKLSGEEIEALSKGNVIEHDFTDKDKKAFTCSIQFDASKRQLVVCHKDGIGEYQNRTQAKGKEKSEGLGKSLEEKRGRKEKTSRSMKM